MRIEEAYQKTILEAKPKQVKFTVMKKGKPTVVQLVSSEKDIQSKYPLGKNVSVSSGNSLDYDIILAMFKKVMSTGKFDEIENNGVTVVAEPLKESLLDEAGQDIYDLLVTSAKTIAYRLELDETGKGYPKLEALYKKADSLLMSIEKNKKNIKSALGE